jgi:2-phospho-L-lactate guanylyltransferase (CobY/MobA/RfbA family)
VVSHQYESTVVVVPVSSTAEAAAAVSAGAQFVDPGTDDTLASALRGEGFPVLDADIPRIEPGDVAGAVAGDRRFLVDVDGVDGGTPAAAGAVAAVCAWQGARLIRTRYVTEVRRCLDMTESILGIRPPASAIRGLALTV